jgi:hypothetical protein
MYQRMTRKDITEAVMSATDTELSELMVAYSDVTYIVDLITDEKAIRAFLKRSKPIEYLFLSENVRCRNPSK